LSFYLRLFRIAKKADRNDKLNYLFDIETYNCIKMPKVLWKVLYQVEQGDLDHLHLPELLKDSLFKQLLAAEILVPESCIEASGSEKLSG